MPRFDYRCSRCGLIVELRPVVLEGREMLPVCVACWDPDQPDPYAPMEKLPAAPNFAIRGYNARNGYSK